MFRFADPEYLWLLWLIPLLALLWVRSRVLRRRRLRRFGDPKLLRAMMPLVSRWRPAVKFWLLEAALALIIVVIVRPQAGTKISNEKHQGIETMICLDISNSMLAEDVEPSRLMRSKMMVEDLVDHFTNDKIGMVVFAGDAFVQLPITSDYVSAKMFLDDIDPSLIGTQGTDIGEALRVAMHSFSDDSKAGKAVIIITDGEDNEGHGADMAKKAADAGINVFVLGIGTSKGAPIPQEGGGYMTDENGQTVISRLNDSDCRGIAKAGKGIYIHVDNSDAAEARLDAEISKLQKGETSSVVYSDYAEQFQAVAVIVLVLLIIETLISEARNPKARRWKLFGDRTAK